MALWQARNRNRTLAELRHALQIRLGFAHTGQAATIQAPAMDSYLQEAQSRLWWQHDQSLTSLKHDEQTIPGERYYDFPDDCDPRKLIEVTVEAANWWRALGQGIGPQHYSLPTASTWPLRFDIDNAGQLELWPTPQSAYTLRIEYYPAPARFTEDGDRSSVDDDLVLWHALADAKAHYGMADATSAYQTAERMLRARRAHEHSLTRYTRNRVPRGTDIDGFYSYPADSRSQVS